MSGSPRQVMSASSDGVRPLLNSTLFLGVGTAFMLANCDKPSDHAAAAPAPSVTVAQPTKRMVTDWDEFTGRFDAVEQVQIRAHVTGFGTKVAFKDGAIVKVGNQVKLLGAECVTIAYRRSKSETPASTYEQEVA
ncbi:MULTISPECIES: hypothetical protein [unclassified Bradyrhizobium]|uniref:hypothetical protein n=1 Tax=unclassified Bradyrhizobium TaxID=2631580 RepID=UPI0032E9D266